MASNANPTASPSASTSSTNPDEDLQGWRPTNWAESETPKDRLFRKFKQQPLVPAGCLLTCAALVVATHHLRKGNREKLNQAFRWRIYFQGITVVGALGGLWYYDSNAAAPVPPPPSREAKDPTAQAYHSIATAPGRPPTNSQVAKEQNRQATTRHEWQDRFRAAQNREDGAEDQKKLEQALLKGVNLEEIDQQPAAAEATTASASAMMTPAARADIEERRRNRPIIGQDGRDRRGGGG